MDLEAVSKAVHSHFDAWERGVVDKLCHPLLMRLDGPGTDKSRLLDEES
jgi:hypothetical protein